MLPRGGAALQRTQGTIWRPRGGETASAIRCSGSPGHPRRVTFRGHPGVTLGRHRNPDRNARRTAMRFEWIAKRVVGAAVLVWAGLAILAGPAAAQLSGGLRYSRGYGLGPNPPVAGPPTTVVLYWGDPNRGGGVVETSDDPAAR